MSNRPFALSTTETPSLKEGHARVARLVFTAREALLRTRGQLEDLQAVLGQVEGQAGRLEEISARLGAMTIDAATRHVNRPSGERTAADLKHVEDLAETAKATTFAHRALLTNLAEARAKVAAALVDLDVCLTALDGMADEMGAMVAGDLAQAVRTGELTPGTAWSPPKVTLPRSPLIDRVGELWPAAKRDADRKN